MPGNPGCTVYIGNLDERVNDRVLYEILIQAGRVVDMYIPRDKETNRHKGYAFAEYETEEIADYAVKLFSGLVTLYNRTLKFAISGQDKPSQNSATPITPMSNSPHMSRSNSMQLNSNTESVQHLAPLLTPCRFSAYTQPVSPIYPQAHAPGLVVSNGYRSEFNANNFDYSKRAFGAAVDSINSLGTQSNRTIYDSRNPISYPSY